MAGDMRLEGKVPTTSLENTQGADNKSNRSISDSLRSGMNAVVNFGKDTLRYTPSMSLSSAWSGVKLFLTITNPALTLGLVVGGIAKTFSEKTANLFKPSEARTEKTVEKPTSKTDTIVLNLHGNLVGEMHEAQKHETEVAFLKKEYESSGSEDDRTSYNSHREKVILSFANQKKAYLRAHAQLSKLGEEPDVDVSKELKDIEKGLAQLEQENSKFIEVYPELKEAKADESSKIRAVPEEKTALQEKAILEDINAYLNDQDDVINQNKQDMSQDKAKYEKNNSDNDSLESYNAHRQAIIQAYESQYNACGAAFNELEGLLKPNERPEEMNDLLTIRDNIRASFLAFQNENPQLKTQTESTVAEVSKQESAPSQPKPSYSTYRNQMNELEVEFQALGITDERRSELRSEFKEAKQKCLDALDEEVKRTPEGPLKTSLMSTQALIEYTNLT